MSFLRDEFIALTEQPPAYIIQHKVTVYQVTNRLQEIARCEQFRLPLTPGMTEMQCYDAIFELDHEADGAQISEDYRNSLGPMDWAAFGL